MFRFAIPDGSSKDVVADWTELCVAYTQEGVSKVALAATIESSTGDEPSEDFINTAWRELSDRETLYGKNAPFKVQRLEILPKVNWEQYPGYLTCVILSLIGDPENPTGGAKLFERLSNEAVKNYIEGNGIVYGHPAKLSIREITELINEKFKSELPQNYKDRGVDIIAWKPFHDQRGNQIIVLMQCAGGKNWLSKTGDVVMRAWVEEYIGFHCSPVRGFSTAVVVSDPERFFDISLEADLFLDRTRLHRYTSAFDIKDELKDALRDWCNQKLNDMLN